MAALLTSCAGLGNKTFHVTEAQIQEKLNQKLALPLSLLKIFNVSLSNALVKFDQTTGRMYTTLDTHLSSQLFNEAYQGKLGLSGKLRFDAATRSVVLDEPEIETFNLNSMQDTNNELLQALAKIVGGQMLNGMTLYTVKPEDLVLGGRQYQPKDLQVTPQGLQITLAPQP
ncbi:MAG TPA: DUF1439 domain-containing protein [Methylophilus sp.]